MEEPDSRKSVSCGREGPYYSTLNRPGRSPSTRSTPCRSTSRRSTPGRSASGRSTSVCSRSTTDRSTTPEAPPVPPATYHWEEVRRKRSVGGYPWTHLNKPPFDENTWVKYERDHVYEPVTPAASTDRISPPAVNPIKDDNRHFLRIPLTEELVMADDTGSEPENEQQHQERRLNRKEEDNEDDEEDDDEEDNDDDDGNVDKKNIRSDESIYEGENENSSLGDVESGNTRMKVFQQKVKVKADILRTKLQGVTKRKPKQKIVVDTPNGEKSRRKFGQFATLPKKFTFNAPKVNFSTAFGHFSRRSVDPNESSTDETKSIRDETKNGREETKIGRFSLPRFGLSRTSSESPKPSKSAKIGGSRLSIPGFRARTWSDASKVSKPESPKPRIMDFGTYPRIFSKRRKTNAANKAKTPPPSSDGGEPESNNYKRKDSFHRRFFRSHKESTPAPTEEQTATLAVEEELDEPPLQVSKESLAEFGDSDLQEVISLSDDCSRSKDTKSLYEHRSGVIEEIDSDEFFLREKGLSRGNVHISNYLSSEIRDVFRSNRTRSVEGVNDNGNSGITRNNRDSSSGIATPVRPSRTNSLRRPNRQTATEANTERSYVADRFSTMPKSFGGTKSLKKPEDDMPENIITSQTFEPSQNPVLPSGVPWRTSSRQTVAATVTHMPPKPPTRQRMSKFSSFDTRSMIDLSRKRSQSQIGFQQSMNFSETVPKAPMRRSRTSLAGSDHDISVAVADCGSRPLWAVNGSGAGVPTPPLRRSRMSLSADADVEERSATAAAVNGNMSTRSAGSTPPRPPPPRTTTTTTTTSSAVAGYATVDKSSQSSATLLLPPQSPMRHRRKKSYDVIKSQEFGAFFTIPRSYSYSDRNARPSTTAEDTSSITAKLPPPSRPARAYNTLGPSRPLRRRLPVSEHEYGDVAENGSGGHHNDEDRDHDRTDGTAKAAAALCSGDVIEKMKLRPLPSPPPPPRKSRAADDTGTPEPQRRRNTDSALVPFLDRRETSATSSNNDFFADVSRALLASAAKNAVVTRADDDVSVAVQTDPSPAAANGYASDGHRDDGSCCSADSYDRPSKSTAAAAAAAVGSATCRNLTPNTLTATDRPRTRSSSQVTEYVDRPTSSMSVTAADDCSCNGYAMVSDATATGGVTAVRAQRITVEELQVGRMIVADILGQRMAVDETSGSSLKVAQFAAAAQHPSLLRDAAAAVQAAPADASDDPMTAHVPQLQDDTASVQSSRVSSMYPEVDSDEDRASVLAAPTPPRRRSKPPCSPRSAAAADHHGQGKNGRPSGTVGAADLSTADPSITELSCQLFRLCHSNVCSLFTKVVQQVVPEDTEKRRDLQAALCFLSIILAGLLILGFGNEKTIHHHHWDFQFPPNQ